MDTLNTARPITKLSISAAHRVTGKSRTTLAKHMREGKLSWEQDRDGNRVLDAAELIRVYGDGCDFSRADGDKPEGAEEGTQVIMPAQSSTALHTRLHSIEQQLATLAAERHRERQQLQSQVEHLQDALRLAQEGHNRATLLLENRGGVGEAERLVRELEARLAARDETSRKELEGVKAAVAKAYEGAAKRARDELLSKPWWRVVWE